MHNLTAALVGSIVSGQRQIKIEVFTSENTRIGLLTPVTVSDLEDNDLLDTLVAWRNSKRTSFLTQAKVTRESTRNFIAQTVFQDPTRLLFLVHSTAMPVGTIGVKLGPPWVHGAGPTEEERRGRSLAELANLLLGARDGHPMLMYFAEMAVMEWIFRECAIDAIWTAVPSQNRVALTLHRYAGFQVTGEIPLHRREKNGSVQLSVGRAGESSSDGLYAIRIELGRAEFLAKRAAVLAKRVEGAQQESVAVR